MVWLIQASDSHPGVVLGRDKLAGNLLLFIYEQLWCCTSPDGESGRDTAREYASYITLLPAIKDYESHWKVRKGNTLESGV